MMKLTSDIDGMTIYIDPSKVVGAKVLESHGKVITRLYCLTHVFDVREDVEIVLNKLQVTPF